MSRKDAKVSRSERGEMAGAADWFYAQFILLILKVRSFKKIAAFAAPPRPQRETLRVQLMMFPTNPVF